MIRRSFLKQLAALPLVAAAAPSNGGASGTKLKIVFKSAWGSDDPTKAAFPFRHGDALAEPGHEVQIFLLGEAVSLMRKSVANAVVPVGWPPLPEVLTKIVALCATSFLSRPPLLCPGFALGELQVLAGSRDNTKCERGRRSLEILKQSYRARETDLTPLQPSEHDPGLPKLIRESGPRRG